MPNGASRTRVPLPVGESIRRAGDLLRIPSETATAPLVEIRAPRGVEGVGIPANEDVLRIGREPAGALPRLGTGPDPTVVGAALAAGLRPAPLLARPGLG